MQKLVPHLLKCEHLAEPRGLNNGQPRFTWALRGTGFNRRQTAYRIVVSAAADLSVQQLWDSGKIESSESLLIPYAGKRLTSNSKVYWAVEVWDENGQTSGLCEPSVFWTGLMSPNDWHAQWISRPWVPDQGYEPPANTVYDNPWRSRPADYVRKEFIARSPVVRAILYITALGLYEPYVNGQRIGDEHLAPGWTDYHTRVEYQLHDVTGHIVPGSNCLGAVLGEGWYAGRIGMSPQKAGAHYGGRPVLLAQLHLEYADGTSEIVATDGTWKCGNGAIVYSDLLLGEKYDARLEQDGWSRVGFDQSSWHRMEIWDPVPRRPAVNASRLQPIRKLREFRARHVRTLPDGEMIFDIGQNISGHCRLTLTAPEGSEFSMRHAEMLTPDGALYTTNLRDALQTDIYIAKGKDKEIYEPTFTYHGFQFIGVTAPAGFTQDDFTLIGIAIHSDTPEAGSFSCGNEMVNKLYSNLCWSQRDNFTSVPTDCPQRNERLGWIADAQIFLRTAGFNADVSAFFTKWMIDVADTETDGGFADIAPSKPAYAMIPEPPRGAPAWGDGAVIIPWLIYLRYGDKEILERHYDSLVRWMELIERHNPNFVRRNYIHRDYGDWLNVGPATPRVVVNTAYWGYLASTMARISNVLGRRLDHAKFQALFDQIKEAFQANFVEGDGKISGDTQTGYLLALDFDLLDATNREGAVRHLARVIDDADGHLQTGFLGVKHLCPVLSENGLEEYAYSLLLKDTYPSWGFSIRHGATTIWERWDGWTPENGFQSPKMNSFNHYSYGSIGEWLFSRVAGIDYDEEHPGFRKIKMRPIFSKQIGWCKSAHLTHLGEVASEWSENGDAFKWTITVPSNCEAEIDLGSKWVIKSGIENPSDAARYLLGSGTYNLTVCST